MSSKSSRLARATDTRHDKYTYQCKPCKPSPSLGPSRSRGWTWSGPSRRHPGFTHLLVTVDKFFSPCRTSVQAQHSLIQLEETQTILQPTHSGPHSSLYHQQQFCVWKWVCFSSSGKPLCAVMMASISSREGRTLWSGLSS